MLDICVPVHGPLKSLGYLRATLNAFLSCEWVVGERSATRAASSKWTEPLFIVPTVLFAHAVRSSRCSHLILENPEAPLTT